MAIIHVAEVLLKKKKNLSWGNTSFSHEQPHILELYPKQSDSCSVKSKCFLEH